MSYFIKKIFLFVLIIFSILLFSIGYKEMRIDQCLLSKDIYSKYINQEISITTLTLDSKNGKVLKLICRKNKIFLKFLTKNKVELINTDTILKINNQDTKNLILSKATDITISGLTKILIGVTIPLIYILIKNLFKSRKKTVNNQMFKNSLQ